MSSLWQDLRFGIRVLSRNPGFTAVAIAALALGIGANSAIFSVIYGVLLKPLPYRDPERLVRVYENNPVERFEKFPLSPADFLDYRKQNGVFQDIATYVRQDQQYGGERPERLTGVRVSYRFFGCSASSRCWAALSRRRKKPTPARRTSQSSATASGSGSSAATRTSSARPSGSPTSRSASWA